MKALFSLKDLLREQMRDLYDAELHFSNTLPRLISTATSPDLEFQLKAIAVQAQANAARLKRICELLGVPPTGVTCQAMEGLLREAKDTTHDWGNTATIDAALIANAQRIVHYEIAGFGTGREFASCLGEKEATELLGLMRNQAIDNDEALNRIATGGWLTAGVNAEAVKPAA